MRKFSRDGAIILGPPRSGTTLLRRLIDAHPNICCPPEPYLLSSCGKFLREEKVARGVPVGPVSGLSYSGIKEEYILDKLRGLVDDIHTDLCIKNGKKKWVNKDGFSFFYIDEIERLIGDFCKYICIIRHGFDVAISLEEMFQKLGAFPGDFHNYIIRYPVVLEACAHLWVDVVRRLKQFGEAHEQNSITIRYEDLIVKPEEVMLYVCKFLGETYKSEYIQDALANRANVGLGDWKTYAKTTIDRSNKNKWRSLPSYVISDIARIVNPALVEVGYDPIPIPPAPKRDYYKKALRLGLLSKGIRYRSEKENRKP